MSMAGTPVNQTRETVSPEDVESFWHDGFAGPFALQTPADQLEELSDRYRYLVRKRLPQPLYDRRTLLDWHLVDVELERLLTQDAIVNRVARLLCPDLLLWRSEILYKPPDGRAAVWHQELDSFADLTVWVALDEVTASNGPLQFATGGREGRVEWSRVPIVQSASFADLVERLSKDEIVARTRASELVQGVDTATWLDGFDVDWATLPALTNFLRRRFDKLLGQLAEFVPEPESIATMVMSRGSFVIFSERILHGSLPNLSNDPRMAVSCRIARADTLVYPGRLIGNFIDGSGVDIHRHKSVLVAGNAVEHRNIWRRKIN
jgi:non-heme Fe2+,alpha-ketoglutarate-dependent halogenase